MAAEQLLREIRIGKKISGNRMAVLPAEGNDALAGGAPSGRTVSRYKGHARGGAGIIFSEAVAVDQQGRARKNQLCLDESTGGAFTPLVQAVREENRKVLFILQLDHAGSLGDPAFSKVVSVYPKKEAELLSDTQIEEMRDKFITAAVLAEKAGADGIDLKFSHGFLLNEIIQPKNTRQGKYGGSFENRAGFGRELIEGIKSAVSSREFLVGIRISVYEGVPGGFGTEGPEEVIEAYQEPVQLSRIAEQAGAAFISVSAGNAASNLEILLPNTPYPDAVFRHFGWQKMIKQTVSVPVIGAGYSFLRDGNNTVPGGNTETKSFLYWAEKNLKDGVTDIVGIGRQGIADSGFPGKIMNGRFEEINFCKTCSGCGMLLGAQEHIGCVQYDDYYKELYSKIS